MLAATTGGAEGAGAGADVVLAVPPAPETVAVAGDAVSLSFCASIVGLAAPAFARCYNKGENAQMARIFRVWLFACAAAGARDNGLSRQDREA